MGREELPLDPRFADLISRSRHHDELDEIIGDWTRSLDKYELMHLLQGRGIPAGPVLTGQDIHFDPHYQSRNFLERVTYPEERKIGTRLFMGRPYKYANTPLKIRKPAPAFGEDNEDLLMGLLGLGHDSYQRLVEDAIISSVPLKGDLAPRIDPQLSVEQGLLGSWDPDYRDRLGIS